MPTLSAKVFRTYNASVVLHEELAKMPADGSLSFEQMQMFYTDANTRVAILCNHQRAVAGDHNTQLSKLQAKRDILEQEREFLAQALEKGKAEQRPSVAVKQFVKPKKEQATAARAAAGGGGGGIGSAGGGRPQQQQQQQQLPKAAASPGGSRWLIPGTWERRAMSLEAIQKLEKEKQKQIVKLEYGMQMKSAAANVSLSTSRVNYMDPRITVAWCKRHDIPVDTPCFFGKSLVAKFCIHSISITSVYYPQRNC
eukprot:SAG22_NODE_683_length_7924_cov_13.017508_2_plen_254_part_00